MPLIRSFGIKPIIEDVYTRNVTFNSSENRQDYQDYILGETIEADRCVAVVEAHPGYWIHDSQKNYGIGFLAELTSNTNLRLWAGGRAISDHGGSYFTFNVPITIYRFDSRPRRIETVMTTNNAIPSVQSVTLSSAVDRSRTMVFNRASAGTLWIMSTFSWDDSDSITFHYTLGCIIVEF